MSVARLRSLPYLGLLVLGVAIALSGNGYWSVIATRASVYWVLVAGLNLVVGFAGQLAIGYVAVLAVGAYTASALVAQSGFGSGIGPVAALAGAAALGAVAGALIGLAALRLRSFYFAMATLGLSTVVTQIALGWSAVTGGGVGLPGPVLPGVLSSQAGFELVCLVIAGVCTWLTANIAASRFGRGLIGLRDAEVAAEMSGVSKPRLFAAVFAFSGALGGLSGGLFASLQSYITPDAFSFDLSVLFFIAILVGGRGSILGPLLGTVLLTLLPEVAAPLVAWSTFLYAALLLVIVLAAPGGIAELLDFRNRRPLAHERPIVTSASLPSELHLREGETGELAMRDVTLQFGGVRAIDGLSLSVLPGEVHGLIGPNGSGKTTSLNVLCGFATPDAGSVRIGKAALPPGRPQARARRRVARTFQTPRILGESSVLDNVLLGAEVAFAAGFAACALSLPAQRREEAALRTRARAALRTVGLESLAEVRADRLQHSELRFLEIARALMLRPAFLLLDEPAAGLSPEEIRSLGALIRAISDAGAGVLLVEHHADLIFDVCDRVTVLALGRELASGTPDEIRAHREVVHAYLGG